MEVLWPELVEDWGLTQEEHGYIDRQQGLFCGRCGCSLRSMALANAILVCFNAKGTFLRFVVTHPLIRILEVNTAGQLTRYLKHLPRHTLVEYPDVDLTALPFKDGTFDLVIHSDTLEHVSDPVKGLAESRRVLRTGGITCYTVPIVVGRLTATRGDKKASFHGTAGDNQYLVHTEYGSDAWIHLVNAGFSDCRIIALEYPAGLAMAARKA